MNPLVSISQIVLLIQIGADETSPKSVNHEPLLLSENMLKFQHIRAVIQRPRAIHSYEKQILAVRRLLSYNSLDSCEIHLLEVVPDLFNDVSHRV